MKLNRIDLWLIRMGENLIDDDFRSRARTGSSGSATEFDAITIVRRLRIIAIDVDDFQRATIPIGAAGPVAERVQADSGPTAPRSDTNFDPVSVWRTGERGTGR